MVKIFLVASALMASAVTMVQGHSWIDTITSVNNSSNVGYPRGYMGHIDAYETYGLINQPDTASLCRVNQRDPTDYTTEYPRLSTYAGDSIVASYTENGHVTKDKLAPNGTTRPGTYNWYWTGVAYGGGDSATSSSQLHTLSDLSDSTLLSGPHDFDDGKCAVDSDNSLGRDGPIPCEGTFTIPSGTAPGLYMLAWVWNFPKVLEEGYQEIYTTCMDVEVLAVSGTTNEESTASDEESILASVSSAVASSSAAASSTIASETSTTSTSASVMPSSVSVSSVSEVTATPTSIAMAAASASSAAPSLTTVEVAKTCKLRRRKRAAASASASAIASATAMK
ncbi:hypothetical protein SAICODRAFT_27712 [Saitoella complicata NRRL Y-17804]|uniref:DUF7492 domain-containing protein n=1 Tax=Saitoella complicata (strain BCRC 22490 / CBS 7301 / JCM 7358 / NBRC 10748 / NRRL Y-17804) TaxID=698492 RepID=A0A0E9NL94_SAICN|nr:uncharacterized protein SAICODRAFT_27712 [Saitoella complicata NRRL Y-17804]ODQ50262.1 hypothetical protein SAICODRAFT_27712 [Saitoella complicata NRRL Y-17804]GAO50185.1 hypothetical protein G7K_4319-t1 [Saitoella complicata NRRL Y-17804]